MARAQASVTYEVEGVETAPVLDHEPEVERIIARNYPPLLRDAGVAGTVTVRLRVLSTGSVDPGSVSVLAADHEGFIDPALRVARGMRFAPGTVGGTPVDVWIEAPIRFQSR